MEFKITLTLSFILIYFFLKFTMRWSNKLLKENMENRDPKAAHRLRWFFSENRIKLQERILFVFILIFLVFVWLGLIPEEGFN